METVTFPQISPVSLRLALLLETLSLRLVAAAIIAPFSSIFQQDDSDSFSAVSGNDIKASKPLGNGFELPQNFRRPLGVPKCPLYFLKWSTSIISRHIGVVFGFCVTNHMAIISSERLTIIRREEVAGRIRY